MLTSEVLNKAADLIEERGWGGDWSDHPSSTSPLCLEGAIFAAVGDEWLRVAWLQGFATCPAYDAVARYLDMPTTPPIGGSDMLGSERLYGWNDETTRTASEVIEVLRAAAAIEQARESQPAVVTA